MSLLGERETQIIFETGQKHVVSSIGCADNKLFKVSNLYFKP